MTFVDDVPVDSQKKDPGKANETEAGAVSPGTSPASSSSGKRQSKGKATIQEEPQVDAVERFQQKVAETSDKLKEAARSLRGHLHKYPTTGFGFFTKALRRYFAVTLIPFPDPGVATPHYELSYWEDEESFRAAAEPKGIISVRCITEVCASEKVGEAGLAIRYSDASNVKELVVLAKNDRGDLWADEARRWVDGLNEFTKLMSDIGNEQALLKMARIEKRKAEASKGGGTGGGPAVPQKVVTHGEMWEPSHGERMSEQLRGAASIALDGADKAGAGRRGTVTKIKAREEAPQMAQSFVGARRRTLSADRSFTKTLPTELFEPRGSFMRRRQGTAVMLHAPRGFKSVSRVVPSKDAEVQPITRPKRRGAVVRPAKIETEPPVVEMELEEMDGYCSDPEGSNFVQFSISQGSLGRMSYGSPEQMLTHAASRKMSVEWLYDDCMWAIPVDKQSSDEEARTEPTFTWRHNLKPVEDRVAKEKELEREKERQKEEKERLKQEKEKVKGAALSPSASPSASPRQRETPTGSPRSPDGTRQQESPRATDTTPRTVEKSSVPPRSVASLTRLFQEKREREKLLALENGYTVGHSEFSVVIPDVFKERSAADLTSSSDSDDDDRPGREKVRKIVEEVESGEKRDGEGEAGLSTIIEHVSQDDADTQAKKKDEFIPPPPARGSLRRLSRRARIAPQLLGDEVEEEEPDAQPTFNKDTPVASGKDASGKGNIGTLMPKTGEEKTPKGTPKGKGPGTPKGKGPATPAGKGPPAPAGKGPPTPGGKGPPSKGPPQAAGGKGKSPAAPGGGGKGMSGIDLNAAKAPITPKKDMKPLWWGKLTFPRMKSGEKAVWHKVPELTIQFAATFEQRFAKPAMKTKKDDGKKEAKKVKKAAPKKRLTIITDPNLTVSKEAALRSFPSAEAVAQALLDMDPTILTPSRLAVVKEHVCPTPAQVTELEDLRREHPTLPFATAEEYMWYVSRVPAFQARVDCWMFISTYEERASSYAKVLSEFLQTEEALFSKHLLRILSVILSIGNHLNGSTSRGQADGFDLETLDKLSSIKDTEAPHKDLRHFAFEVFFLGAPKGVEPTEEQEERSYEEASSLMSDLAPIFRNVHRSVIRDSEGTLKVAKNVRVGLEDAEDCVKELMKEFQTQYAMLQACLQQSDDPADPMKLFMAGNFAEAKTHLSRLEEQSTKCRACYTTLLDYFTHTGLKSSDLILMWDNLFIPGDLILNKPDNIRKRDIIPRFCRPRSSPSHDDMMLLWDMCDISELGKVRKPKTKQPAEHQRATPSIARVLGRQKTLSGQQLQFEEAFVPLSARGTRASLLPGGDDSTKALSRSKRRTSTLPPGQSLREEGSRRGSARPPFTPR